jgi:hypothetical protein
MHFQQPNMLWGLLLLAIPLLIHLFQFHRTKTIYFPGVFRLTQKLEQARHKKRLQHWLVLLSRMLGIACVVLAFAMPSCDNQNAKDRGYSHVVLLIDNGFSMSVEGADGLLIEQAKSQARAILQDLPSETQVKLISQTGITDLWMSPSQIATILDTLGVGPQRFSLKDWVEKVQVAQQESGVRNMAAIVFSDAQSSFFQGLQPDAQNTIIDWRFVSLKLNVDDIKGGNLSLDTAWYVSQFSSNSIEEGLVIKARVTHRGGEIGEAKLTLSSNGKTRFAQTKSIKPGETIEFEGLVSANYTKEPMILMLGKDGYQYDNQLYLHPVKTWKTQVGVLGGDRAFDALFSAQPLLQKKGLTASLLQQNPKSLQGVDAMVVLGTIPTEVGVKTLIQTELEKGITLLQFPVNVASSVSTLNALPNFKGIWKSVEQRMALAGLNHPVFQGAFAETLTDKVQLPVIRKVFQCDGLEDWETVIQLESGLPLLVTRRIENGSQWLWLSDLQEGSKEFLNSSWFLPLVTQILASNAIQEKPLYGVLFSRQLMSLPAPVNTDERAAQLLGGKSTSVVELQTNSERHTSMYVGAEPSNPGHFQLKSPVEKLPITVSFNWPRLESNLQTDPAWEDKLSKSAQDWKYSIADGQSSILQNEPLKVLWRLFIWGAAIFFAVEVMLLLWPSKIKTKEN